MVPKNAQKPPNFKRLLVPKLAHLHWAQDQGGTIKILHRGGYQNLLQYYNGGTAPYKNLIRNADSCEIQCLSKAPQRGWD